MLIFVALAYLEKNIWQATGFFPVPQATAVFSVHKPHVAYFFGSALAATSHGGAFSPISWGRVRAYLAALAGRDETTNKQLEKIEFEINNRPMRTLDWRTAHEHVMANSCTGKV